MSSRALVRNSQGILGVSRAPPAPLVISTRKSSHIDAKLDLARKGATTSGSYSDLNEGAVLGHGQLPARPATRGSDSGNPDGPEFKGYSAGQSIHEFRAEEAKKKSANRAPRRASIEERKKEMEIAHRRRRSSDILDAMQALQGDEPVRQIGGGVPELHASTLLYGKPSEMNAEPKFKSHKTKKPAGPLVNVQAPLYAKMRRMLDHFPRPASRVSSSDRVANMPTYAKRGSVAGIRPTRTSEYGKTVDMRDPRTKYHLTQKQRRATSAQRQLDLLNTQGLPVYTDEPAPDLRSLSATGSRFLDGVDGHGHGAAPARHSRASAGLYAGESTASVPTSTALSGTTSHSRRLRTAPLGAARGVPVSPVALDSLDAMAADATAFPFSKTHEKPAAPAIRSTRPSTVGVPPSQLTATLSRFDKTAGTGAWLPSQTSLLCSSVLDGTDVDILRPKTLVDAGSSISLAHLNKDARRPDSALHSTYINYALHPLRALPSAVQFGQLRQHTEYCFPVRLHNASLVAKRFRISSLYLEPESVRGRLRARHLAVKLAPGMYVQLLVIFRGDESGPMKGVLDLASDEGVLHIPLKADVLKPIEFANAVRRNSRPVEDGEEPDIEPMFADYIVPLGHTHPSVVPLLPAK